MRIVAISDTHGLHNEVALPPGDVLVHAGDITEYGEHADIQTFISWFARQRFKHKIFIAGNHDFWAEKNSEQMNVMAREAGVHYLCDNGVSIEGVHFWGSPRTPKFMEWAFMLADSHEADSVWQQVPDTTHVLITHGPPHGVLDELNITGKSSDRSVRREHVGCTELIKRVQQIGIPLHIFGHIHEGYGIERSGSTRFVNASQLDNRYQCTNQPISLELDMGSSELEILSSDAVVSEIEV